MNKRKRIVAEHALALFVEKGIAQTSIQDILTQSGISKGTFYNYFSSKNECVSAILEQARYDATLMRAEFMIGQDPKDLNILSEQIAMLSRINRSRGLDVVLEEILHSGDRELKKEVLKYRVYEFEWLASRFEEVFQLGVFEQAFEGAIIFYGILQHLSFSCKMMQQSTVDVKAITDVCLIYMQDIMRKMVSDHTNIIDEQLLHVFMNSVRKVEISFEEVIERLEQFAQIDGKTKQQQQITDALLAEVKQQEPREIVVNALLQSFAKEFINSPLTNEAKEISSVLAYVVKQVSI